MNDKNYIGYSAEQLLEDDFFLESFFNPTIESHFFWEELKRKDEVLAKEILAQSPTVSVLFHRMIRNYFGSGFLVQLIKNNYLGIGILRLRQWLYCYCWWEAFIIQAIMQRII